MIRWKIVTNKGKEYVGDWNKSKKEAETKQYLKEDLDSVGIQYKKEDGMIEDLVNIPAADYERFSWACVAYNNRGADMNVALCLETKSKDIIVNRNGEIRIKEK